MKTNFSFFYQMFKNREDAGRQLGKKLLKYKGKNTIILAIPRGGVPVGYEIAKALDSEFNVIISRKLPLPDNPEAGFGAISEESMFLNQQANYYPGKIRERIIREKKKELTELIEKFRGGKLLDLEGKVTILVDDGLAMGSTMLAAIETVKKKRARKIVVAVPTASYSVIRKIKRKVDEVVCIDKRRFFLAVADAYENWYDLTDEEVLKYLENRRI